MIVNNESAVTINASGKKIDSLTMKNVFGYRINISILSLIQYFIMCIKLDEIL